MRRSITWPCIDIPCGWSWQVTFVFCESWSSCCPPETTAHSLSFALAFLALHPDIQEKLYDEVVSVWPQGPPRTGDASVRNEHDLLHSLLTPSFLVIQERPSEASKDPTFFLSQQEMMLMLVAIHIGCVSRDAATFPSCGSVGQACQS
jgi:Cytochrome P450